MTSKTEVKCDACNGTGFPTVTQPLEPDKKIYPAPCKKCGGKGRVANERPIDRNGGIGRVRSSASSER